MNPEILQSIQRRLLDVESKIQATDKKLTALKIDKQMFIPKSERIKPGIAIKVAYNEYGQITGSSSLETVDIPQLAIEKIDGLSEHLKSSVKTSEIEKLKKEIKSYFTRSEADITGCKVNVNKNGIVTSVSDLTVEDIPELPINKISGLTNILESLKQSSNSVEMITVNEKIITAGTGCKISFDEYGRVTNSENLSINDLPLELINKIQTIESIIGKTALQSTLDEVIQILSNKVERNKSIKSGTFTKLTVDEKGLVVKGDKLDKSDLPELTIDDIQSLRSTLNDTVDRSEVNEINKTVSAIISSLNKLGNVTELRSSLDDKVSSKDLREVKKEISEIKELINRTINNSPGSEVNSQIKLIMDDISTIKGRLFVIENKYIV